MENGKENPLQSTENAIQFLLMLEEDTLLAERCERTDLEGRLAISTEVGLPIVESELRRAITMWDYYGTWHKWLHNGRLASSLEDLPELEASFQVSDDQIQSFRENGHILLRDIVSQSKISPYRPVIRSGVERFNPQFSSRNQSAEDRAFLQTKNLRMRDEAAKRLITAPLFGKIAADLLGAKGVRIYMDQALIKERGGMTTHWHQDSLYFPLDTDDVITMWLPLVDVSAEMGTLRFANGSHKNGYLGFQPIGEDAETYFNEFIDEHGFKLSNSQDLNLGDASFHHGWVLHGAPPNTGDRAREVLVIVFYPDGTLVPEPENVYQERVIKYMYRGPKPGEPANSPINQLTYSVE